MGLFGSDREKNDERDHKWAYINLSDFRSHSCWTPFTYVVLYISLLISIACYGIDIFTCSQLLLFDKWSGQIQPVVPLEIARWIFTGCILLSLVLLVYRWIRAIRVIKTESVSKSYLDPLAVRLQSIRMGQNGQGWRRFLLFAELTKSKKGSEYVALFAYFSFEASLRILLAEGPRQAINAMTLVSVMQSQIIPSGDHSAPVGSSPIAQFFINVKILAQGNQIRAVVLFGMLFTLIIWIIAALGLAIACILYIVFLWHHIPSYDGGLKGFCKRKIDSRLQKIVDVKVKKAMEREEKRQLKSEAKALKSGESTASFKRQPTLPVLDSAGGDQMPQVPSLNRQDTLASQTTFTTQGSSNPSGSMSRQPTLPNVGSDFTRPTPTRSATQASALSYSSNAPLMGSAAPMGYEQDGMSPASPNTPLSDPFSGGMPPLSRSQTGQTQVSQRSYNQTQGRIPLSRQNTFGSQFSAGSRPPLGPNRGPIRQNTNMSNSSYAPSSARSIQRQNTNESAQSGGNYPPNGMPMPSRNLTSPPTLQRELQDFGLQSRNQNTTNTATRNAPNPYVAYNPGMPAPGQGMRSFSTQSGRPPNNNFNRPPNMPRSGTAPPGANTYDDSIYDSYRDNDASFIRPAMPVRAATAGPNAQQWR